MFKSSSSLKVYQVQPAFRDKINTLKDSKLLPRQTALKIDGGSCMRAQSCVHQWRVKGSHHLGPGTLGLDVQRN